MCLSEKHSLFAILLTFTLKLLSHTQIYSINPIQDGHFWGCSRMGGGGREKAPLPKICHTYPTVMKLGTVIPYLKKIQKIFELRDTPPEFC